MCVMGFINMALLGTWVMLGQQLDSMAWEVFSSFMDSPKGHFQPSEPELCYPSTTEPFSMGWMISFC